MSGMGPTEAARELAEYLRLSEETVAARMAGGIEATALSYLEAADPDAWYRDTDAYLFELANWEGSPLHRDLARYLGERLSSLRKPVLDYGCGIGSFVFELAAEGFMVAGADLNRLNRDFLRHRVAMRGIGERVEVLEPTEALARRDTFGMVFCQHVLEHVADPAALLARLRDCLIPGGAFFGVAPFDAIGPEFPEHRPEHAHLTLDGLCEEAGFIGVGSTPFGGIGPYVFHLVFATRPTSGTTA
jgi:SAM-dependent methyltransferase